MKETVLYLSEKTALRLHLPETPERMQVYAGQNHTEAHIRIAPGLSRRFSCSSALKNTLGLSQTNGLRLRWDEKTQSLHIGPFVGIITLSLPHQQGSYRRTSFLAELLFLARISRHMKGRFFFFRPGDVCWQNKTVRGYRYTACGTWEAASYPLPDVIYDRLPSRRLELSPGMKRFRRHILEQENILCFNSSYLNKWNVYQKLVQSEELRSYLPETHLLNTESLSDMLSRYPVLFAKPANGSMGRGIIKIRHMPQGFSYTLYRRGKWNGTARTPAGWMKNTRKARRGWMYIIQQGIALKKWEDSAFDLRIILQKDGLGEWKLSKRFFRVARRGSSVANLSSGGHVEPYNVLLPKLLHHDAGQLEKLNREISWLCRQIATKLEEEGCFGELGLDLGIGKNGKVWLIEVNSKPRKATETEMSMQIVRNTFRRPLEFASFLAGFPVS